MRSTARCAASQRFQASICSRAFGPAKHQIQETTLPERLPDIFRASSHDCHGHLFERPGPVAELSFGLLARAGVPFAHRHRYLA